MGWWVCGMRYYFTVADIISYADQRSGFDPACLAGVTPVRTIEGRNTSKADLLFFDLGDRRVAVKTYAPRNLLVRSTIGRWLIRRETNAYQAAAGVDGLPAFLGRVGAHALATEWVDAVPLRARLGERLDDAHFDRLESIVRDLHGQGVALADLHHRDVLLGEDGQVFVVDLATAWVLGSRPGSVRRRLFERFRESDRVNLARMRARFTGGDVEAAGASVSPAAENWHRIGRRVKGWFDRLRGKHRG
jgi:hypothetical protein